MYLVKMFYLKLQTDTTITSIFIGIEKIIKVYLSYNIFWVSSFVLIHSEDFRNLAN